MKLTCILALSLLLAFKAYSQTTDPVEREFKTYTQTHITRFEENLKRDSINKAFAMLRHENDSLRNQIQNDDEDYNRLKKKFELYSLITQYDKDSIAVLITRFPLLRLYGNKPAIELDSQLDLELRSFSMSYLSKKFPKFWDAIADHELELDRVLMDRVSSAYGLQVPDIPTLSAGLNEQSKFKKLCSDYDIWLSTMINATHCDSRYIDVLSQMETRLPAGSTWKQKAELKRKYINFIQTKCYHQ